MAFARVQANMSAEAAPFHVITSRSLLFSPIEMIADNSFEAADFTTYCPGDLLRQSAAMIVTSYTKDHDDISEVSTADPQDSVSFGDFEPDDSITLCHFQAKPTSLPSIGSAEHDSGNCKPCAFFYKGAGCSAGTECKFCHICPPGTIEKKRKSKRKFVRLARHHEPSLLNAASETCTLSL